MTDPRKLTAEELEYHRKRLNDDAKKLMGHSSQGLFDHIAALEQEVAEARSLHKLENKEWHRLFDESVKDLDQARAERDRFKAALELIVAGAPSNSPDFDPDDLYYCGSVTQHVRCAGIAREALEGKT